jgi:uncharacterized protein YndB with AHSA1/START domain
METTNAIFIERLLSASPRQIFAAFEQPEKLAVWWGPKDFTNTFEQFEFEVKGSWVYVMHGPDGRDYPNECVFRDIEPDSKIVIDHVVKPLYTMTITLAADGVKTLLTWDQQFENEVFAEKMHAFLTNAGNENLDRLEAVMDS